MTKLWQPDRDWYERRLDGFGGSEAGALLGISPWQTARDVVEAKARRIIPDPDAPQRLRLRMGRDMEPILLEHLWETMCERDPAYPHRPRTSAKLWRSGAWPWMTANVDGFMGPDLVELKTDEYGSLPWGPEDGDPAKVVPPAYYAQVQHDMAATGKARALLFVQLGLHAQLLYLVPRDDQYVQDLAEYEGTLWALVEAARARLADDPLADISDLLPALEGEQLTEHLRAKYPTNTDVIRSATPDQELLLQQLRDARLAQARADKAYAALAAKVQDIILDAAGITSPLGTVTWRQSADRTTTDWDLVAASYRALLRQVHQEGGDVSHLPGWDASDEALDTIVGLYTHTTPGSRRFLPPTSWTKE